MFKKIVIGLMLGMFVVVASADPCASYSGSEQAACNDLINNPDWINSVKTQFVQNHLENTNVPTTVGAQPAATTQSNYFNNTSTDNTTTAQQPTPVKSKRHQDIFQ